MNNCYIERASDSMVSGQVKQAISIISEGCKTKPYVLAARSMRVHEDLRALGYDELAQRLFNAILYKGESK